MWSVIASHKIRTALLSQELSAGSAALYSRTRRRPSLPSLAARDDSACRTRSPQQKCRQRTAPLPPQSQARRSKAVLCSRTASGSTEHPKRHWAQGAARARRGQWAPPAAGRVPAAPASHEAFVTLLCIPSVKVFGFMQVILLYLPLNDGWDSHRSSALLKEITIISEASQ